MSEQENREVEEASAAAGSEGASPPAATSEKQAQEAAALHAAELAPSERPRLMGRVSGGPQRKETLGWARPDALNAEQRLLILDAWQRSKLTAVLFAPLVGLAQQTLLGWKRRFEEYGPAALENRPRGSTRGSRLGEATKRAILMLKTAHPEWGCERLSDVLWRSAGCAASAGAVARLLKEQGYTAPAPAASSTHAPVVHRFERARVNQLWQSDLFTFLLKRESRRVYLVVFMDDHSRFIVSWGLHASAAGALVREALLAGVANFGAPEEVLTDNGPQYATWRGTSAFTRLLRGRGIKHLLAHPRRPRTLGKVERFWGSLWRECLEAADIRSLDEARVRVGLYIDHYNFHRPHQGLEGLTPADRYFEAAPEVLRTLRARVAPRAGELARAGVPRKSFYLTGRIGDAGISVHAEGERIVLTTEDGRREEVDLAAPGRRQREDEDTELPALVTPQAGYAEVRDDDDDETDAGEPEADAGDEAGWDGDGEDAGGGDSGDAGGTAHAGGGGERAGDHDGAVLRAGGAGAAGTGGGAGAAAEGAAADAGAAGGAAGAGAGAADARADAGADAAARGAADDRADGGVERSRGEAETQATTAGGGRGDGAAGDGRE